LQNADRDKLGDPKKAALAMIQAVDSDDPPMRLVLGADAVGLIDGALEFIKAELDAWQEVAVNTAFEEALTSSVR